MEHIECLLWGGYGWGNTGDELNLAAAIERIKKSYGDSYGILTPNPSLTQTLFPESRIIPYQPRFPSPLIRKFRRGYTKIRRFIWLPDPHYFSVPTNLKSGPIPLWVHTLRSAKCLYLVGGGYLTDLFDVDFFLLPVRIAKQASVPVRSAPIGIGPFVSPKTRQWVSEQLQGLKLIVRDANSQKFCAHHNISAKLSKDDGLLFLEQFVANENSTPFETKHASRVGVCIFLQHGHNQFGLKAWWVQFLKCLRAAGAEPEGFCFHTNRSLDFDTTLELFTRAGIGARVREPIIDFREAIRSLHRYRVVISTRFHGVVSAHAFSIPYLAIANGSYYYRKMNSVVQKTPGPGYLITPGSTSPTNAAKLVLRLNSGN